MKPEERLRFAEDKLTSTLVSELEQLANSCYAAGMAETEAKYAPLLLYVQRHILWDGHTQECHDYDSEHGGAECICKQIREAIANLGCKCRKEKKG